MAAPKQTPAAKGVAPAPKKKGKLKLILGLFLFGLVSPFIMPTLLLGVGMIPTLVALVTDTDPRKSAASTVGFLNFAGVVPFIISLWEQGQTMDAALHILGQSSTWLIMLGGAAVGHLILYAVPPASSALTINRMETRLRTLKEGLEQLKTIWGSDVATKRSLDDVRSKES